MRAKPPYYVRRENSPSQRTPDSGGCCLGCVGFITLCFLVGFFTTYLGHLL